MWQGIFAWIVVSVAEDEKMPEIESKLIVKQLRGTDLTQAVTKVSYQYHSEQTKAHFGPGNGRFLYRERRVVFGIRTRPYGDKDTSL